MSSLARTVIKDINILDPDEVGRSDIVDLTGCDFFSCQANYVVDTPVNATIAFQGSNDGVAWTSLQAATTISSSTSVMFNKANAAFKYFSVLKALDSGTVDLELITIVTGDSI